MSDGDELTQAKKEREAAIRTVNKDLQKYQDQQETTDEALRIAIKADKALFLADESKKPSIARNREVAVEKYKQERKKLALAFKDYLASHKRWLEKHDEYVNLRFFGNR